MFVSVVDLRPELGACRREPGFYGANWHVQDCTSFADRKLVHLDQKEGVAKLGGEAVNRSKQDLSIQNRTGRVIGLIVEYASKKSLRSSPMQEFVIENPRHPGPEAGPSIVAIEFCACLDECYLGKVGGIVRISGEVSGQSMDSFVMIPNESFDRLAILRRNASVLFAFLRCGARECHLHHAICSSGKNGSK